MPDGTNGPQVLMQGGILDLTALVGYTPADFPGPKEADAGALAAGWKVEDRNHRCPDCAPHYGVDERSERRGMYIDATTGEQIP